MGEAGLADTIAFWTKSVGDYLGEYFETDVIKAHMAGSGIIGTALGVYSPGTAYVLLHHYMGDVDGNVGSWGFARGGMGAVADSIAKAFKSYGGEIICDADVDQIMVRGGKTTGVALRNGDEYLAPIVVSNLILSARFSTSWMPRTCLLPLSKKPKTSRYAAPPEN